MVGICELVEFSSIASSSKGRRQFGRAAVVKLEHDGNIEVSPASLRMRDATVNTCIKWNYGV